MPKKQKKPPKISNEVYEAEIFRLQTELVKLQEWTRDTGARILVIFEGRDAAGKGGAIKRMTEYLSPRIARVVALPTPSERERGQWYYQRYVAHLPSKGEIVLFDRSWYNRAGVEKVMGFCTPEEYSRFMRQTPIFEQMLIDDGIMLRKYWFNRWEDYSRAKDEMMIHTDTPSSPWFVVESDIKKHARLNMIAHLLSSVPYTEVPPPDVELPKRLTANSDYERPPRENYSYVPDHSATLLGDQES